MTQPENTEQVLKPTLRQVASFLREGGKVMTVDADYLCELVDYFEHNTNYTIQVLGDSQERIRRYEARENELLLEIKKLTNKVHELIKNEPDPVVDPIGEPRELEGGFSIHIIPLSKIAAFLNTCVNKFADCYIKLDSKGNFVKFGTSEKELL